MLSTFYVTFPQKDRDRRNHWIEINAVDYDAARQIADLYIKPQWSHLYSDQHFNRDHFPGQCLLELSQQNGQVI